MGIQPSEIDGMTLPVFARWCRRCELFSEMGAPTKGRRRGR
jgi:hypothetical protein